MDFVWRLLDFRESSWKLEWAKNNAIFILELEETIIRPSFITSIISTTKIVNIFNCCA
jgi:hypothetical protein